ncbi:MAG: WD40/YVTN/BNR-like repeat-containing protein, partial [Mycobacteriales bacterium]
MTPMRLRRPVRLRPLLALLPLTAVALLATAAAAPAATAVRVVGNHRLAPDTLRGPARDAPGLAVDPADSKHVVAVDVEVTTKTCEFFVSKDAGRTWKRGALAAPDGYPERPCAGGVSSGDIDGGVVFGSGQNVYVTFAAKKVSDGSNHILVARSTDGGTTFATAVETPGTARYPKIAVQRRANGDRLYVAGSNVLVTRSDDAGQSWQPLSTPYASGASVAEATQPAVDSAGTVY